MSVLTTAIDAGINLRCASFHIGIIFFVAGEIGTCLTNRDIRLVHIAGEECRTIEIEVGNIRQVRCSLTGTTTEDITVWQLTLHAHFRICFINITDNTAKHLHSGLTAAEEVVSHGCRYVTRTRNRIRRHDNRFIRIKACRRSPQRSIDLLTIADSTYSIIVDIVITTASIVTLTDGAHVTAAIDITSHVTAIHGDIGITKHLTRNEAVDLSFIVIARAGRTLRCTNL